MHKIIVMTDIHIGSLGETIIGIDTSARFATCLSHALHHHGDAEALILMGDLTHHGRPDQYARLRDALTDCPLPIIPMLGNHDRRAAFVAAFSDAPQTPHGHIQQVRDIGPARIITLDTLDGPPYPAGHHAGRLGPDRLAWLDAALATRGGRRPLVFAHHPPFDTGIIGMDLIKLSDPDPLITRLRAHGAHLFCGHIHRTISGSLPGLPWSMFKSPAHQGVLDMTDPDSSLSVDEPGAYGVILLSETGVVAHQQDVGAGGDVQRDAHSHTTNG